MMTPSRAISTPQSCHSSAGPERSDLTTYRVWQLGHFPRYVFTLGQFQLIAFCPFDRFQPYPSFSHRALDQRGLSGQLRRGFAVWSGPVRCRIEGNYLSNSAVICDVAECTRERRVEGDDHRPNRRFDRLPNCEIARGHLGKGNV